MHASSKPEPDEKSLLLVGCHDIVHLLAAQPSGKSWNVRYNLYSAAGYEEARREIENKSFDACLVNFDLGDKSGLDLVRDSGGAKSGMPFYPDDGSR